MIIEVVEDFESVEKHTFHQDLTKGISVKKDPKTIFFTPKGFAKTFTPERIRVLLLMKKKNFSSISELSKQLNRPFESVHRDIKHLESVHLIELKKDNKSLKPIIANFSFKF